MNEQDNQQNPDNQANDVTKEPMPQATTESAPVSEASQETGKKSLVKVYIISIIVAAAIILGALYFLESEGRSNTNIFSFGDDSSQSAEGEVVAVVNGTEIYQSELDTSMQQFAQMAQAQGVDLTTPEAQAEIRGQALDVLINTELLKQSASEEGITVSDEQAQERRDNIVSELGGEEALQARIQELGIPEGDLMSDIEEELLIQAYLDSIFAQSEISVSDEEVQEVYDQAGASGGELPPLEDVRPQVEQQIITTKEQEIIDQLLIDLKAEAEIETN